MFNQVRAHLEQMYPSVEIHGGNLKPPGFRALLSNLVFYAYISAIVILFAGDQIFPALGIQPPQMYRDAQANKV